MNNLLVYHVDIGRWITCDFSMLSQTVSELKLQIEKKTDILVNDQVLLVSGGSHLDPSKAVSYYGAGTDTNPFFLFSKNLIAQPEPPFAYFNPRPDLDLTREQRRTQRMQPTIEGLNVRVSLSQQYTENAQYNLNSTEILINDQHMMHQGWSTAVANMLDTEEKFKYKAIIFENYVKCYLDGREDNIKLLNSFDNILKEISEIPMLPALLESNSEEFARMHNTDSNVKNAIPLSLLDWVTACQGLTHFEHIFKHCENSMKKFDEEMINSCLQDVSALKENSFREKCSEIKGLEPRLFKLAQMMDESKCLATEQFNLAKAIRMNHAKATSERDTSVINVLIASSDKQLEMMNRNNIRLCGIRNRSIKAKQELCKILHPRLKWLIDIENKVSDIEAIMLLYSDSLKLTREYLDVIEQLSNTPKLYFNAVAEVVRRQIFSQTFLTWSRNFACHMMSCHLDEIAKRKNFQSQFEGHFLNQLFPGLEDMPPLFATQAPPIFDYNLPKLSKEDLNLLCKQFPQIAHATSVPNSNVNTQFFLSKSIQQDNTLAIEFNDDHKSLAMDTTNAILGDIGTIEEKLNEMTVGLASCKMNMQQESEVITRTHSETESDCYNPQSFILPYKYTGSQQENTIQLSKNSLYNFGNQANMSVNALRRNVELFKQFILQQKVEFNMFINDLKSIYDTPDFHQQNFIRVKNNELNFIRMQNELETLVETHNKSEKHKGQLQLRLQNQKDEEKDEWIKKKSDLAQKEITIPLKLTHEEEIEMIQSRYKLVSQKSNVDCSSSSSEQSFEKSNKCDVNEFVNHEVIIAKINEDLLIQKEQVIQDERKQCEQRLARECQLKYEDKKDNHLTCSLGDSKTSIDEEIRPLKYPEEKSSSEL